MEPTPLLLHLRVLYVINFDSVTCELTSSNICFIYSFPRNLLFLLMHMLEVTSTDEH